MDINHAAPAVAVGEIQIDADPQTVFSVIAGIDEWPSWNTGVKTVKVEGSVQPGTVFRWKTGPETIVSTLQVVDRPDEIGWTGVTMGIRAIHVFRFEPNDGGTLARSEESWDGALASVLKGYSRRTLGKDHHGRAVAPQGGG